MDNIKHIADGLSALEREWITGWKGPAGAAYNAIATGLLHQGLLIGALDWGLSEKGQAVRKHLESGQ